MYLFQKNLFKFSALLLSVLFVASGNLCFSEEVKNLTTQDKILKAEDTITDRLKNTFDKSPLLNPAFHGMKHALGMGIGYTINSHPRHYGHFELSYSIPTHLFFHGRTSLEVGTIIGTLSGTMEKNINQVYGGFLHEFIFDMKYFYPFIGFGAFMKSSSFLLTNQNDSIASHFVMQVKIGVGMNITDNLNLEVYYKHFSNGTLNLPNEGYNFAAIGVKYLL